MDRVADGFGNSELSELDAKPRGVFQAGRAVQHEVVVAFRLDFTDRTAVILCLLEAFESELCGQLVVVVIPHQLSLAAPD